MTSAPGAVATLLDGCAARSGPDRDELRRVLAPSGALRVGVYAGSPTSLVRGPDGVDRGVTAELGRVLAQRLGVAVEQVELARVSLVIDALQAGTLDFTVTNATAQRAERIDFTSPLIDLELGVLTLPDSPVQAIDDLDRPGQRIGVTQGGTSEATLAQRLRSAHVVPAASLAEAAQRLAARELDAFATNKAILFELADSVPGARVLPGRWGVEHLAIAVPKGRRAGARFLEATAQELRASGAVREAAQRAGLRGVAPP